MEEKILKALYYVRKKQILQSYHSEYGGRVYSESYVFAVKNDCYPYFHIEEDDEKPLYKQYEELLIKAENDIRKHIKVNIYIFIIIIL